MQTLQRLRYLVSCTNRAVRSTGQPAHSQCCLKFSDSAFDHSNVFESLVNRTAEPRFAMDSSKPVFSNRCCEPLKLDVVRVVAGQFGQQRLTASWHITSVTFTLRQVSFRDHRGHRLPAERACYWYGPSGCEPSDQLADSVGFATGNRF